MTAGGISISAPWKRRLLEYELLAPLPASLVQTLRLLKDQRSSVHDLIKVLQYDPAVTADILKLCNSPYYGLSRNVSSLKESLLLIGTNELHRMIHTLVAKRLFERNFHGYEEEKGELWRHSLAAAMIGEELQKVVPRLEIDLFTTALLHDVGKIVLDSEVKKCQGEMEALLEDKELSFSDAETKVLGINHAVAGAYLLERWHLPEPLVEAVLYHHSPGEQAPSSPALYASLANVLAHLLGFSASKDALLTKGYPDLYKAVGIQESDLEKILARSLDKIHDTLESLLSTQEKE